MEYKIKLADGTSKIIQILATTFKKLKVWKVRFDDGREILLYKVGTE